MDWVTAIKEIQKAQEDDRLVIFVGAGVSKNSGVPSWWELIRNFGDELGYSRCDTCQKKVADCPKSDCKDRYEYTQYRLMKNAGRNSSQLWKNRKRQGKHSQGCVLFLTG